MIGWVGRLECRNLNISRSMCRSILSLHKKSQITATHGELGRPPPLGIDIVFNVMQFIKYLEMKRDASIMHEAWQLGKTIKQPLNSRKTWASETLKLNKVIGAAIVPKTRKNVTYSRKSITKGIESHFRDSWTEQINTERKIRTYRRFKTSFEAEDYLFIKNNAHRKSLTN